MIGINKVRCGRLESALPESKSNAGVEYLGTSPCTFHFRYLSTYPKNKDSLLHNYSIGITRNINSMFNIDSVI